PGAYHAGHSLVGPSSSPANHYHQPLVCTDQFAVVNRRPYLASFIPSAMLLFQTRILPHTSDLRPLVPPSLAPPLPLPLPRPTGNPPRKFGVRDCWCSLELVDCQGGLFERRICTGDGPADDESELEKDSGFPDSLASLLTTPYSTLPRLGRGVLELTISFTKQNWRFEFG